MPSESARLTLLVLCGLRAVTAVSSSRSTCRFYNRVDQKEVAIYFRTYGTGKSKVVMIMGTAAPHDAWQRQIDHLSHSHQVCVFDNRGTGLSSVPDGPYTTDAMAEDTLHLMNHLGWRRAHVVGFSLGGMVAMKLASRCVHRIKSLALISTHTGGFFRRLPTIAGIHLIARIPFVRSHELRTHIDLRCHYNRAFLETADSSSGETIYDRLFRQYLSSRQTKGGCRGLSHQVAAVLSHRMSTRDLQVLRETDVPKLVAHGDRDVIIHPSNAVTTAGAIDADLEILAANHMSVIECADQLNLLISAHVDRANAKAVLERSPFRLLHRLRVVAVSRWRRAWAGVESRRDVMHDRISRLRYYRRHYLLRRASQLLRLSVLGPIAARMLLWVGVYASVELAGQGLKAQARKVGRADWFDRMRHGATDSLGAALHTLAGWSVSAADRLHEGGGRLIRALREPAAWLWGALDARAWRVRNLAVGSATQRIASFGLFGLPGKRPGRSALLHHR